MAEIRTIDAAGNFVEANSPQAAYLVNMGDPRAAEFVASVKARGGVGDVEAPKKVRRRRKLVG